MGTGASFGYTKESSQEARVDYNRLLALTFFDLVRCDSRKSVVVNQGHRVVRISARGVGQYHDDG